MASGVLQDGTLTDSIINGVKTVIYPRLSSSTVRDSPRSLLLCIPGSPGVAEYYVPFVDHLYNLHKGTVDVCVVSHAGHSPGGGKKNIDKFGRDWYSLQDQIDHKVAFINEYYPNVENLQLIGHSIGSYMILQMLDQLPEVKKSILLFPTIERFSQTPNGQAQRPFFNTFRWLALFIFWLSTLFPMSFRRYILQIRFRKTPPTIRDLMVNATLSITHAGLYTILCMAEEESVIVDKLPVDIISRHHDNLVFYYGVGDRWNLPSFYQDFVDRFPNIDATLCCHGIEHAFILKSSQEIAEFCYKKLNNKTL